MGFWNRIFGKQGEAPVGSLAQAPSASPETLPSTNALERVVEVKLAENEDMHAQQLISRYAKGQFTDPKFGTLMLPGDMGLAVNLQTHVASFIKMSGESEPFFVVRCDKDIDQFRTSALVLAFSFCRFHAGGMVFVFFGIDLPGEDTPRGGLVEASVPLDSTIEGQVQLMEKTFQMDRLHVCFAKGGKSRGTIITSDDSRMSYSVPECQFDSVLPIPKQAAAVLATEYKTLKDYHLALPPNRRSVQACMNEANEAFPPGQHPIIGYRFV